MAAEPLGIGIDDRGQHVLGEPWRIRVKVVLHLVAQAGAGVGSGLDGHRGGHEARFMSEVGQPRPPVRHPVVDFGRVDQGGPI